MQRIKEHIKTKEFKPVYLLYGTEDYLKKLYKEKLREGIVGSGDDMNYSYFEGKHIDLGQVMEIGETLPFFQERRLIILENTGLFKNSNEFSDYIKRMASSTCLVFVENEVDKRNKLYKMVKDKGIIVEMNGLDEKNLILWMASLLDKSGKKATEKTLSYLLSKAGSDMETLSQEIEKLICYSLDQEVVGIKEIDEVCHTQITGRIFQMIDAIGAKKQTAALKLYEDLLSLRERPMTILFLITRHFNILLQIKELVQSEIKNGELAKKVGIPPFAVGKYAAQGKNFTEQGLKSAITQCAEVEEQVKTGRMTDQLGVEMLIVAFSAAS